MKIQLLSLLLLFCLSGCMKRHLVTVKLCDQRLYVEVYQDWAYTTEDYLTDSAYFHRYIGTYDQEHEHISYSCFGDTVFAYKFFMSERNYNAMETQTSIYSLRELNQQEINDKCWLCTTDKQ